MNDLRVSAPDGVSGSAPGDTSATPLAGDRARAMVSVAVSAERAFSLFTKDINLWWRRGPRFRNAPGDQGMVCIEPHVGGRVFESFVIDGVETVVEMGTVMVWSPPQQLVFKWRAVNFAPGEWTEVEVNFQANATDAQRTRVVVEHRGWRAIRPDHPVRHGLEIPVFIRMMGLWWGDQLTSLREHPQAYRDLHRHPHND